MISDVAKPSAIMRIASKSNVHRIESSNLKADYKNMSTGRILWATGSFLAYRHRVGLLMLSTASLVAYIAWDKFLHLFF